MKKSLIKILTLGTILSATLVFAQPPAFAQATTTTPAQTKAQKKAAAKAAKASATTTTVAPKTTAPVVKTTPSPAPKGIAPKPAPAPMAMTSKPAAAAPAPKAATPKAAPTPATSGDIVSAKSKGMVWVNLNTKVYHGSSDKEYGTTKNGKFMTEADAKAAGARAAKH
jgi:hypothetical protein